MSDQRVIKRVRRIAKGKLAAKNDGPKIIKIMERTDYETGIEILQILAEMGGEAACNHITHFLDHPDPKVRIAACKAALTVNTDYMHTRVRHQLSLEQDAAVKAEVQAKLNEVLAIDAE